MEEETLRHQEILDFLKKTDNSFRCNQNISENLTDRDLKDLEEETTEAVKNLLNVLLIDQENDWNTKDTARRVAKMYLHEIFHGRYYDKPEITAFPNGLEYDELYMTGPIPIRSTCAHHLQNITGNCWVGIFPGTQVIGLSKFNRLIDWIAARPTIQEELSVQIADEIEEQTQAQGVGVIVKAEHHCMLQRGVKAHENDMTTSVLRGDIKENKELRQEFFELLKGMKGYGT